MGPTVTSKYFRKTFFFLFCFFFRFFASYSHGEHTHTLKTSFEKYVARNQWILKSAIAYVISKFLDRINSICYAVKQWSTNATFISHQLCGGCRKSDSPFINDSIGSLSISVKQDLSSKNGLLVYCGGANDDDCC